MTHNKFFEMLERLIGKQLDDFQRLSIMTWIPQIDRNDDDELIQVRAEHGNVKIQKRKYVTAKWKALSESKYPCLTVPQVADALDNVLRGIIHDQIEMEIYPDIIIKKH